MTIDHTTRLTIRRFTPNDSGFIQALTQQPDYIRYIGDRKLLTLADAAHYITTVIIKSYQQHGFGLYRVAEKHTDQPLGMVGLINRPQLPHVDLGFAFLRQYCRQGYAYEASKLIIKQAYEKHHLSIVQAITTPDNQASIALLEKLHFQFIDKAVLFPEEPALNIYQCRLPTELD